MSRRAPLRVVGRAVDRLLALAVEAPRTVERDGGRDARARNSSLPHIVTERKFGTLEVLVNDAGVYESLRSIR